ncbi:MAG: rod-binding protein [Holophagaceae bacterium]|nr:rod-binding protein [Holophagaceae bacterium]
MIDFPTLTSNVDPISVLQNAQIPKNETDKIAKTAAEFEGMLMAQMIQMLRKTVEPSGLFDVNQTERSTYEYLLDQAIVQHAVSNGQTWGLAERLEESWRMLQARADGEEKAG